MSFKENFRDFPIFFKRESAQISLIKANADYF